MLQLSSSEGDDSAAKEEEDDSTHAPSQSPTPEICCRCETPSPVPHAETAECPRYAGDETPSTALSKFISHNCGFADFTDDVSHDDLMPGMDWCDDHCISCPWMMDSGKGGDGHAKLYLRCFFMPQNPSHCFSDPKSAHFASMCVSMPK